MIRVQYIHEYEMFDDVSRSIALSESAVDEAYRIYLLEKNKQNLSTFMEESEEDEYMTEASVKGVLEAVGKAVENAFKRVRDMIDKMVSLFQEKMWDNKSEAQKLEVIMSKHPNIKDDIKMAVKKGDIEIKDIKSLQDVLDGSYDIMGKLRDGKIEPSEAEEKWDKLVDKYHRYGKPIVEVASGVTAMVSAVVAVKTMFPKLAESKKQAIKTKNELKQWSLQKKLEKMEPGYQRSYSRVYCNLCGFVNNHFRGVTNLANRTSTFIHDTLTRFGLIETRDDVERKLERVKKDSKKFNAILNKPEIDKSLKLDKKREDRVWNEPLDRRINRNLNIRNEEFQKQVGKNQAEGIV